ncbi:MAG: hypothetical protein ACR2PG_01910 [Hyphomicrobiaceae bacterium]
MPNNFHESFAGGEVTLASDRFAAAAPIVAVQWRKWQAAEETNAHYDD